MGATLVLGGAGYIGSHTVAQLLERGEKVLVLDNLATGNRWAVPQGVEFIEASCGQKDVVEAVLKNNKVQTVIHFAASLVVPESVSNPQKYYLNNTVNTAHLLEACLSSGVRHFVFSSTAATYGIPKEPLAKESTPLAPINPYGASKMMSERMLMDASQAHPEFQAVILRYFNVAGAREDGKLGQANKSATQLIKVASEVACGNRPSLDLFGTDYDTPDGTCVRDYIHVDDLAEAHLLATDYLREGGKTEVFNCGYGHGYSVREVISTMKKVSGVDFKVVETARRPGDPPALVAASDKIKSTLNWKPKRDDLELICRTSYEWEKSFSQR